MPPGQPLVGYAGHFNYVKAADVLATSFAALARERPDLRLAIAWTGQGAPESVRQTLGAVAGQVSWLGKVDIAAFLSAIDMLVLPYRSSAGQSAFPALMVEAMHIGCPLVTTDLPLIKEMVEHERTALLCPPERPDLLAVQMKRLIESDLLRQRLSAASRTVAAERFDPDVLAGRYEELYSELIRQPAHSERQTA